MDLRTSTRQLGEKEESNKKRVRCEVFFCQEESRIPEELKMNIGARKSLRMGLVPAECERVQGLGISLTERWRLEQQMAAAAGKKDSVSLSLVMERM